VARIRTIKPEFPQSESMGRVSRDARLLFIMLWTVVDDHGRTRAHPVLLANLLFPYDEDAKLRIPEWLMELERQKCITVYSVGDNAYLEIQKWSDHQRIDHPGKSKFPSPAESLGHSRKKVRDPRKNSPRTKEGIKDQGEEGTKEGDSAEPSALAPPVIRLPTNRFNSNSEEVPVSQAQVDDYAETFPAVDVPQQLREMRRWLIDHPDRRKTAGGMAKFINTWLSREQDKGNGTAGKPEQRSFAERKFDALKGGAAGAAAMDRERGPGVENPSNNLVRLAISAKPGG
jgi:hypothetical protein